MSAKALRKSYDFEALEASAMVSILDNVKSHTEN
jgi:hypothetical protein